MKFIEKGITMNTEYEIRILEVDVEEITHKLETLGAKIKISTLNGIINMFEKDFLDIALCAPTGRAAQRMTEATGRNATTIHRLLEVEWGEGDKPVFKRNLRNPLDCQALIIDEMSMVDIFLFSSLQESFGNSPPCHLHLSKDLHHQTLC